MSAAAETNGSAPAEAAPGAKRTTEQLPVRLTEGELADRGQRLAKLADRRDRLVLKAKAAAQRWKDRIAAVDERIGPLRVALVHGEEKRAVEVYNVTDYQANALRTFRLDTHELVRERALSVAERQAELNLFTGAERTAADLLKRIDDAQTIVDLVALRASVEEANNLGLRAAWDNALDRFPDGADIARIGQHDANTQAIVDAVAEQDLRDAAVVEASMPAADGEVDLYQRYYAGAEATEAAEPPAKPKRGRPKKGGAK